MKKHAMILLLAVLTLHCSRVYADDTQRLDYPAAIERLEETVEAELQRGIISGVAIALVDGQNTVLARGYGMADKRRRIAATGESVFRAGSISKLFTAVAAMQLAEAGKLDIDRPVTAYDPGFRIVNPFRDSEPITLRQLMCHRAGVIRESPVGSYFDPGEPTVDETVASIGSCVLVYSPNSVTKYSNVGPTITGRVVSLVAGMPFVEYQQKHLLEPLGMTNSSFLLTEKLAKRLAPGTMWVADGDGGVFYDEAPLFEFGILPAGNLYTTAHDLAQFAKFLLAEGNAGDRQLVRPETLGEMFSVQLTDKKAGFGLGFHVSEYAGAKRISHAGAVYGHTSSLAVIPEYGVGVVVLVNEDLAMGPVHKLATTAMNLLLEAKHGIEPPERETPIVLSAETLAEFSGDFESESYWAEITAGNGVLKMNMSGQQSVLTPVDENRFLVDSRFNDRAACAFRRDESGKVTGFSTAGQEFRRVVPERVPTIPGEWRKYLGSYGPDFIPLVISVKHGHLYAMTENLADYRLRAMNRTVFRMPPGMYVDEQLVFQLGPDGEVYGVILANMELPRRP